MMNSTELISLESKNPFQNMNWHGDEVITVVLLINLDERRVVGKYPRSYQRSLPICAKFSRKTKSNSVGTTDESSFTVSILLAFSNTALIRPFSRLRGGKDSALLPHGIGKG